MIKRTYYQLSSEQRDKIAILRAKGKSVSGIAKRIGRNKSTISRELKRNKSPIYNSYLGNTGRIKEPLNVNTTPYKGSE